MTDKDKVARDILSDITVHMKYARYMPEKERRETWTEIVDRNKAMHIKSYPDLRYTIKKSYLPCAQCNLEESPLKWHPIAFITVLLHPLMIGVYLARLCSCFLVEQASATAYRNIT